MVSGREWGILRPKNGTPPEMRYPRASIGAGEIVVAFTLPSWMEAVKCLDLPLNPTVPEAMIYPQIAEGKALEDSPTAPLAA